MPTLNPVTFGGQDAANPNDPGQILQWILGMAQQRQAGPYSQERLQETSQALNPYFTSQREDLIRSFTRGVGAQTAAQSRMAGERAAFQGRDVGKAQRKASSQTEGNYASQLVNALLGLGTSQQGMTLNAAQSGANYDLQQWLGSLNAFQGALGNATQRDVYSNQSPGIGSWLGAGAFGLLGSVLGPLGGAAGMGIGKELFGKGIFKP